MGVSLFGKFANFQGPYNQTCHETCLNAEDRPADGSEQWTCSPDNNTWPARREIAYCEDYEKFDYWKNTFIDLPTAFVTLWQIFTIDHWYEMLVKTLHKADELTTAMATIFMIAWLLLGSFIFRNIIIGVLVTNFQNIRAEMTNRASDQYEQNMTEAVSSDIAPPEIINPIRTSTNSSAKSWRINVPASCAAPTPPLQFSRSKTTSTSPTRISQNNFLAAIFAMARGRRNKSTKKSNRNSRWD